MPNIGLGHANRLMGQAIAAADLAGLKVVLSVVDSGANAVSFARMDGAPVGCNEMAHAKARTAALFGLPSEALAVPLEVGKPPTRLDHVHSPALLLIAGGLPLVDADGALIGAIGVSGGTPKQDAEIASTATSF